MTVFAGRNFVKHFAQRIDVRLRGAWPFRRDKTFRPDERLRFALLGYQPDVRQLGLAIYEDNVRGLDVAVNQTVLVQLPQSLRKRETEFDALLERQGLLAFHF